MNPETVSFCEFCGKTYKTKYFNKHTQTLKHLKAKIETPKHLIIKNLERGICLYD